MEKRLMARFDVYANPGSHAKTTPYLLDVQSDLLDGLDTRMVIPLRSLHAFPKVKVSLRLTPVLTIQGEELLLETPESVLLRGPAHDHGTGRTDPAT
jgi:toxin CcdB